MRSPSRREIIRKLDDYRLTAFQKKVLLATYDIPLGEVRTYKQIAQAVGHPNSYRAVGSTLKINPLAPVVPCHRVIKSSGELGNYSAPGGTKRKRRMLKMENAI